MSVSPSGMARLRAADPLSADPAAMSVAIDLPAWLHVKTGDVTLRLTAKSGLDETFVLPIVDPSPSPDGPPAPDAGRHMLSAGIAAADRGRFALAQGKAQALRRREDGETGSLSVSINGACRIDLIGHGSMHATIWLRTVRSYFRLASVDLDKGIGATKLRDLPVCTE